MITLEVELGTNNIGIGIRVVKLGKNLGIGIRIGVMGSGILHIMEWTIIFFLRFNFAGC